MTDRLRRVGLALLLGFGAALARAAEVPVTVYVGTYTDGTSRGIYRFEPRSREREGHATRARRRGEEPLVPCTPPERPLPLRGFRGRRARGAKTGAVLAFAIDAKTGDLTLLNQQASEGTGPCHLVVDQSGPPRCSSRTTAAAPSPSCRSRPAGGCSPPPPSASTRARPEQGPPAEAARPRHLPRRCRALRVLSGPRRRPGLRLPLRRGQGHARAARSSPDRAGLGAAPPRLPPVGPLRIRDHRAREHDHGLRLRTRQGRAPPRRRP